MVSFMTRIPVKTNFTFSDDDFRKGIWYIPVIGLLMGLLLYTIYFLLNPLVSPLVLSLILAVSYILVTGGIHLDGLADTTDGLGSNQSRDRMLAIMKDSNIGTFGLLALVIWLAGTIIILSEIPWVCLVMPLAGRTMSLFTCATNSYARESGMGKTIVNGTRLTHFLFSMFLCILVVGLFLLFQNSIIKTTSILISVAVTFFFAWAAGTFISNKLNGITGDVIGYMIESSSLLFIFITYISFILLELL